jgi:hypothetical protein
VPDQASQAVVQRSPSGRTLLELTGLQHRDTSLPIGRQRVPPNVDRGCPAPVTPRTSRWAATADTR